MATVAVPFRAIQPLVDSLLRKAPERTRTEREREQADEIYKSGQPIRVNLFRVTELSYRLTF